MISHYLAASTTYGEDMSKMEVTHVLNITGYTNRIPDHLVDHVHRSIAVSGLSEETWLQYVDEEQDNSHLNLLLKTMLSLHPVPSEYTAEHLARSGDRNYSSDDLMTTFLPLFLATYVYDDKICDVNGEPVSVVMEEDSVFKSIKGLTGVLIKGDDVNYRALIDLKFCYMWSGDLSISLISHSTGFVAVATYEAESG